MYSDNNEHIIWVSYENGSKIIKSSVGDISAGQEISYNDIVSENSKFHIYVNYVYKDYIYYTAQSQNNDKPMLCRIKIDGTGWEEIGKYSIKLKY